MKVLFIPDWDRNFENNRSRSVERLGWVLIPNRRDGEAYASMMAEPDADRLFACWIWLIQVSSRCRERGLLLKDNGEPHTPVSLAAKTRARAEWFDRAIPFFLALGWLAVREQAEPGHDPVAAVPAKAHPGGSVVSSDCQPDVSEVRAHPPDSCLREGRRKEGDRRESLSLSSREEARSDERRPPPAHSGHAQHEGPTLEVVLAYASQCPDVPQEAATSFFNHFAAVGWVDGRGRRIVSWENRLLAWAREWGHKQRAGRHGAASTPPKRIPAPTAHEPAAANSAPVPVPVDMSQPEVRKAWETALANFRKEQANPIRVALTTDSHCST